MSNMLTIDEMRQCIISALPDNVTLIDFTYDAKYFGNMIVRLIKSGKTHTFITDRDEIYHNGMMLCDASYRHEELEDSFHRLLQMISKEMVK